MIHNHQLNCLQVYSSIEDDLRDLPVLHAGPVIVTGGVTELECDLPSVVTVHGHLPQALRAVVTVQPLQRADCSVVGVGLDLERLFEHRSEGGVGSIGGECDLVRSQQSPGAGVDQLKVKK